AWPGACFSFSSPADGERQRMRRLPDLRAQLEAAGKSRVLKRTAGNGVGMRFQGVGAVELDREGRGKERAADFGSGLRLTNFGDGRKEELEHRVAGLPRRLTLEFLLELSQGEPDLLRHQRIGWSGGLGEFQHAGRGAAALVEPCATSLGPGAGY